MIYLIFFIEVASGSLLHCYFSQFILMSMVVRLSARRARGRDVKFWLILLIMNLSHVRFRDVRC